MTVQSLDLSNRKTLMWTSAIFFLHTVGLALIFDPPQGAFNSQPIVEQDWGLHFHHLMSSVAFWQQDRSLWGYNPLFMAGYPSNTIQDLSIKLFEVGGLTLANLALTPVLWFKILAFVTMASVPWLMYFASHNFFFDYENKNLAAASAVILGTAYWWNSLPREMFFYGMIGYVSAAYLTALGVSLLYRIANESSNWIPLHIAWALFAVVILPIHVQSIVILMPPILALLIAYPRLVTPSFLLSVFVAAGVSLVINMLWLVPAVTHVDDEISDVIVNQLPLFTSNNPFALLVDYFGPEGYWTFRSSFWEKGFRLLLLVFGSLGTWKLLKNEYRALGVLLAGALITLCIVSYFGSLMPLLRGWQPLRFKVPFDLFLALATAYLLAEWRAKRLLALPAYAVPLLLVIGAISFVMNLLITESRGRMKLRTQIPAQINAIVDWIGRETPSDARVLFEESGDETGFIYDGIYLSSLVPHLTGRQLIGGPINLYNDRHHFAEFHSGQMFKKDVQTLTDGDLRDYLRLYNIGAVVAFHPASLRRLQAIPGLVTLEQRIGPVHLMKVNQPLTWFVAGKGKVKAGLNRLELSEITGDAVILKYHWVEGLTASPPAKIEQVKMLDDPIPFIKLVAPPPSVTLRVGSSG
jgi:hypothetical protein